MLAALLFAATLAAPTPSPSLSPLPVPIRNYYAAKGARVSGLDPALIRSIIDAESSGDSHAVSRAGAQGLMQLMPGTARACGIDDAFNPMQNVACGSKTLSYLIHDYGLKTGIAAYNFGSGNVVKAGADLSKMPVETQHYVTIVVDRYDALQHAALAIAPPPTPTLEPPQAFDDALATPTPASSERPLVVTCNPRPAIWSAVGMQIVASIVVSNAVRHGATGRTWFGTATTPTPYLAESFGLDVLGWEATRRGSCAATNATFGVLGASAAWNALESRWPK